MNCPDWLKAIVSGARCIVLAFIALTLLVPIMTIVGLWTTIVARFTLRLFF